ncbi:MAG: MBL fold metallo-hydrolase [Bacteroidales bacterium]
MIRMIQWTCVLLLTMLLTDTAPAQEASAGPDDKFLKVTIIYDNFQGDKKLETDWGFGCLVQYGENSLLFDAGRKVDLYKENAQQLKIKPEKIPALFISHSHGDHTAGMEWIITSNPSIWCYLPSSFAMQLSSMGRLPANSVAVAEPRLLFDSFYSTGDDFEKFNEQGLVVRTADGSVLITGCGHPGVVEMVSKAEEELEVDIHTVIGGLHLLRTPDREVEQIAEKLKQMGVSRICPTHCTGDQAIEILKESFGEGYIAGGTGTEIVIE